MPWHEAYQRLTRYTKTRKCVPPLPPKPLILSGWTYSNDIEKKNRWEETVRWATDNGCVELTNGIPDSEFYFVDEPTTYTVGPMGGPMYRHWDYKEKNCPSSEVLEKNMKTLLDHWPEIAGKELSSITRPLVFTGNKARRLLVQADSASQPPWGGWTYLSGVESERRTFTRFRAAVNKAISPHEVDHIDFITDEIAE